MVWAACPKDQESLPRQGRSCGIGKTAWDGGRAVPDDLKGALTIVCNATALWKKNKKQNKQTNKNFADSLYIYFTL